MSKKSRKGGNLGFLKSQRRSPRNHINLERLETLTAFYALFIQIYFSFLMRNKAE